MTRLSVSVTLTILAGGESKRMGRPKHLLTVPGGTILDHLVQRLSPWFEETLVVGRGLPSMAMSGVRVMEDVRSERTPLVGIYTALLAARTDLCFVMACDMPFVRPAVIRTLVARSAGRDVVVPLVNSYREPLCAIYRQTAIPEIAHALDAGERKITAAYRNLFVREVDEADLRREDPELVSFINLNTPRELPLLEGLREPAS